MATAVCRLGKLPVRPGSGFLLLGFRAGSRGRHSLLRYISDRGSCLALLSGSSTDACSLSVIIQRSSPLPALKRLLKGESVPARCNHGPLAVRILDLDGSGCNKHRAIHCLSCHPSIVSQSTVEVSRPQARCADPVVRIELRRSV